MTILVHKENNCNLDKYCWVENTIILRWKQAARDVRWVRVNETRLELAATTMYVHTCGTRHDTWWSINSDPRKNNTCTALLIPMQTVTNIRKGYKS